MAIYKIITLVDITRTNPSRTETNKLKLGQQANFNSLCQAIGLRANFVYQTDPKEESGALPPSIGGKARHWTWQFETERSDIFLKDEDPVALLKEDLNGVPVIDGLNNTADIDPAVFQTQGNKINIWIYEIADIG
jgi:hypothetical protein